MSIPLNALTVLSRSRSHARAQHFATLHFKCQPLSSAATCLASDSFLTLTRRTVFKTQNVIVEFSAPLHEAMRSQNFEDKGHPSILQANGCFPRRS